MSLEDFLTPEALERIRQAELELERRALEGARREVGLVCVHSTSRTRRLCPSALERRCSACGATIVVEPRTLAWGEAEGLTFLLCCTACAARLAHPDDRIAGVPPYTRELLEAAGFTDPDAAIAAALGTSVRDFARTTFRNTIGGNG